MRQEVYIGNYSKGIMKYELNEEGNLKYLTTIGNLINNSFLVKYKEYMFSVSETEDGEAVSYKNEKILSRQKCGELPCFLDVDLNKKIIYTANYLSGSFIAYKLGDNGEIGEELYKKEYEEGSNIHYIKAINDKLYVINLGKDTLYEYCVKYNNDKLDIQEKSKIIFPKESEPRHMVLDKDENIFVVTEKSCELFKIIYDKNEDLKVVEKKSIIEPGTMRKSDDTGCAIKMDIDKKNIYVSVRGQNGISVFDTKSMDLIQYIDCGGECPRDISFDVTGKFLICANQISNNISIYEVIEDGTLKYKDSIDVTKPSCIMVEKI